MLSNVNILILGGDARYLEIIRELSEQGATIYLAGYDKLTFTRTNVHQVKLSEMDFSLLDGILLPVSGCGLSGEIDITYSDVPIILKSKLIENTPKHCVIYTGTANAYLEGLARKRKLICIFDRDDVAILNSIPTAEGTLKIAMEKTKFTIHGSNIMIFGFGRVGITIARLFAAVGANVCVCVRSSTSSARIFEMGVTPLKMKNANKEIAKMDICINTVPYPVIDKELISEMKQSAIIIDIASSPGGTDFSFAKKHGIKAIHALGLPGKVAPETAGKIISNTLLDLLLEG